MKLAALLLMACVTLQAQTKKSSDLFEEKAQSKINVPLMPATGPALEGPIDADKYIVGPSDVIAVNIWSTPPINLNLTVTPEGTLIIPTVGEVKVAGMSLSEAKRVVIKEIGRKYLGGSPTVTLIFPRQLVVKITGEVVIPGRYTLSATDRIDNAIQAANKIPQADADRLQPDLEKIQRLASKRNIRLTHRDGKSVRVDILKFYASRQDYYNPYLLDGDEIFVPLFDEAKNVIGVYGAVNYPARFEYAEGDSLLDAIELAHGLTKKAVEDSVTITRFAQDGLSVHDINVKLNEIKAGRSPNIVLEPGDRIFVRQQYDPRGDYRVTVEGEVLYPGTYPITRENTRVSEVIRRAGGFTEFAAPRAAQIFRSSMSPAEVAQDRLLNGRGSMIPEDTTYFILENQIRLQGEVLSTDLELLFMQKDSSQDVFLRSQDTIRIPSRKNTVYVFGQVMVPGGVQYVSGKNVEYYLDAARGFTDNAQRGDVVIIKRSTRHWCSPSDTKIEEGDYVWVPREVERPATYWLNIIGQSASIISVALTGVILVIQLTK